MQKNFRKNGSELYGTPALNTWEPEDFIYLTRHVARPKPPYLER